MGKESGVNVILQVSDGGSPTSFVAVSGQQGTRMRIEAQTDDITDKTHEGWESMLNVLRRLTVQCQGVANWPDTTGLDLVRAAVAAGLDIEGKIILNSDGAHYRGLFQVSDLEIDGPHNGATRYSFNVTNNGVPTYAAS